MVINDSYSTILEYLSDMRASTRKERQIGKKQALVELLENDDDIRKYKDDKGQYNVFCDAYIIKLLQKFTLNLYEEELMRIEYNFMLGYDDKNRIEERRKAYVKDAIYNELISPEWKNISSSVYQCTGKIMERMAERIAKETTKKDNGGYLKLSQKIVAELSEKYPNGLPPKLQLNPSECTAKQK